MLIKSMAKCIGKFRDQQEREVPRAQQQEEVFSPLSLKVLGEEPVRPEASRCLRGPMDYQLHGQGGRAGWRA